MHTKVKKIIGSYVELSGQNDITEEEFVFESLRNPEFFPILQNAEIPMLHLINEDNSLWEQLLWNREENHLSHSVEKNREDEIPQAK